MKTKCLQIRCSLLLLAVACMAILSGCDASSIIGEDDASGNAAASETFSFELQVAQQNRLELRGINGNIDLAGVAGAQAVEIWGERRVTSRSTADARAYLNNLQVRVVDGNNEILVETVQPENNHGRELQVNYHLRVPLDWQAAVQNINGNIVLDSLAQSVSAVLTNGNIIAQDIAGNFAGSLTNGNVVLHEVTGSAGVALVNGNISAKVSLPPRATCEMNTVNGVIDLQIPHSTSAEFSATLANGTINLIDLILQNSSSSRTSVSGKLGDGAGRIWLKTVNGDIRVRGF